MRGRQLVFVVLCWVAVAVTMSGQAGSALEALEAARKTAVVDGNLAEAIKQYQAIVTRFEKSDRPAAAQALLRMAECYEKQGSAEAQAKYRHLVTAFKDVPEIAAQAQARIAVMPVGRGASAQRDAAPFPAIDTGFITPFVSFELSPDGQWIALSRNSGTEVVLRTTSTGVERRLASGGRIMSISWAPNSSALAFFDRDHSAQTTTLRVIPIATAVARSVMTWPGDGGEDTLLWSPMSDRIAFTTASLREGDGACPPAQRVVPCRWDIRVTTVRPGPVMSVGSTWANAFRSQTYFAWSPDGRRLAFEQRGGAGGEGLRIIDVATGTGTVHAMGGTNIGVLAWNAKDDLLLSQNGDYVFPSAAAGDVRKVSWSKGDELVAVGPGAEWFIVQQASTRKLVKKSATDASEQPITAGVGQETHARLSPDGRLLAFASNRDGKWALYVALLDQLPVERPLRLAALRDAPTNVATANAGGWGTDGTLMTALAAVEQHLYRMPVASDRPATAGPTQITVNSQQNFHPAISPDGTRVAFVAALNNRPSITVMDSDGRNERPLLDRDVQALAWRSPRQLLIKDGQALVALDVDSGAVAALPGSPAFDTPRGGPNWAYVPARDEVIYMSTGPMPTIAGGAARFFAQSLVTGETRELGTRERVVPAGQMLAVAPGGDRLAFVSGGAITIMTMATAADASTDRVLGAGPAVRMAMSWAPDGMRLVACLPSGRCEVVDAVTGAAQPLLLPQHAVDRRHLEAAWSPDGTFIVITGSGVRVDWHAMLGVTVQAVARK